ncbi:MAG: hypothetical protein R2867_46100 [Caldilineaceae bacterium]
MHSPSWMMMMGHSTDVIAVALIASPVVWEHHYLLAMPLAICAVAQARGERQLWAVGISLFLMFVMPTFDVYPFSYHRLLGLVLLMVTLAPVPLPQIIPGWRWRNGKATAVEAQHRRVGPSNRTARS